MSAEKIAEFDHLVNEAADLWTDEGESNEEYERALVELVCRASGLGSDEFRQPVQDLIVARTNGAFVSQMTVARSMKIVREALSGLAGPVTVTYTEPSGQMEYTLTWRGGPEVWLSGRNLNDDTEWASPRACDDPDRFGPLHSIPQFLVWVSRFVAEATGEVPL